MRRRKAGIRPLNSTVSLGSAPKQFIVHQTSSVEVSQDETLPSYTPTTSSTFTVTTFKTNFDFKELPVPPLPQTETPLHRTDYPSVPTSPTLGSPRISISEVHPASRPPTPPELYRAFQETQRPLSMPAMRSFSSSEFSSSDLTEISVTIHDETHSMV